MELVVRVLVLATTPPLIVTVAPLTAAPPASFTEPLKTPEVAMAKFKLVVVPEFTVAVALRESHPLLAAVTA